MLMTTYKKFFIKLSHVYFPDEKKEMNLSKAGDVVYVHGVNDEMSLGVLYGKQNTLIKDLSLSEEEIFLSLGKHLRQYIKRSIKENIAEIQFFNSEEILKNATILEQCKKLYEKMYIDKGMKSKFNTDLAKKYCENNALLIGMAFINENPIGFSAVIYHEKNARLWVCAFNFRDENVDSQVLSRAHQQLDYKLLLKCKSLGVEKYDFGGINSFDNPNGIDQFKMKFESEGKVTYSNYLIPNSLLGKIVIKIIMR